MQNYCLKYSGHYISPKFIKYQQPHLTHTKNDVYSHICQYAQRLHYEKKLHLEGVIYGVLTINSKLKKSDRFSYREIVKKAYGSYCNAVISRPQILLNSDYNKQAISNGSIGGNIRGKQKSDDVLKRITLINKHLDKCIKSNGKTDIDLLFKLTLIPVSSLYRLLSKMNTSQ